MAIQYHLNANHQMKLAEALLRFESMQTPASRDSVVADLPREVKENVRRSNAAREDVLSILHTCLSYTDALEQLLVRVKFGQETSIYLQQLIEVELEVLPPLPLSEELLVELRQALSVSPVSDDLIRLFHGSLPAGAVSPRDPRTAYEGVLRLLQFAPAGGLGFVERLAETAVDPGRARLRAWVRQAAPKLSVEPGQLQAMRQQIAEAVNIPSYLLIQFTPTAPQAETFTVQGWLWRNDGDCRTLSYDDQPHRPVEFEAIVEQFVCEVERETVDLTIELIVPRHLFGQDFTQWRLQIGDMRASLIAQHPIVLRWQERLAEPRLRNRWQQKWQSLKGSDADGSALLFWLARADVNASHLLARLQSADSGLCVALGFTPPTALDQSSDDPLKVVLIMGTPIAIWFREGSNIDEQMIKDQLTNRRPSELPRRVFELRNQAVQQEDAQHIGYQVTLLYDDGDRVPQLLNAGAPRVGGG